MSLRALLLAAALAAASAGCDDKSTTYSYFLVAVTIDQTSVDRDLLDLIAGCGAIAHTANGDATSNLPCTRGHIRAPEFGTFEYTTTLTSGNVSFTVEMKGINDNLLAKGDSDQRGIVPGKSSDAKVIVKAVPGAVREPPGIVTVVDGGSSASD